MQYGDGKTWREQITVHLEEMGVLVLDPYKKPFINDVEEGDHVKENLTELMERGDYEEVNRIMKPIRSYDLSMVDKSDFSIACIDPKIPTFGSIEEISVAVKMKRPVFIFINGSKKKCPLWLMGMMPHKYIYSSMNEVVDVLRKMDSGEIPLDSNRWRLFKQELR